MHSLLSQLEALHKTEAASKPLTTQFVKRAPRLTKALELRKRPQPRRTRMQRKTVSIRPRASAPDASAAARPPDLLPILARPHVGVSRMGYAAGLDLEPQVAAEHIAATPEDEHVVDMSLEMLDVEALDYGKYSALVIQDPSDKRNIKGFLGLALLCPIRRLTDEEMRNLVGPRSVRGVAALATAMNEYTRIRTQFIGVLPFDSPRVLHAAWVYVGYGTEPWRISDVELEFPGKYALSGGFVFVDSYGGPDHHECAYDEHEWTIVRSLQLNGLERGRHWEFEPLHSDHPVYHCFFDFDGPPVGSMGVAAQLPDLPETPPPDAVRVEGRVIVFFSHNLYSLAWGGEWARVSVWRKDNTRQLQYGVNLVVFALTQEGGMAKRLMGNFTGY
jgi:hypothetical protein